MRKILNLILILTICQHTYADQLYYISYDQATKAAEYINTQESVILWCSCCTNSQQEQIKVSLARTVKIESNNPNYKDKNFYKVVLSGITAIGVQETTDLDLAYVFVKVNNKAQSLGQILGYSCDPCVDPFLWPTSKINGYDNQCEDIVFLESLFTKNLEEQDEVLELKGYVLNANYGSEFGIDWVNGKIDKYISIRSDNFGKVNRVQFRLKGDMTCYISIKEQLIKMNYEKDFETLGASSIFYFFYKSNQFGIILSKWLAPNDIGGSYYSVEIHSLISYQKELTERK